MKRDKSLCPACEERPHSVRGLCTECFARLPEATQTALRRTDDLDAIRWHELMFTLLAVGVALEDILVTP